MQNNTFKIIILSFLIFIGSAPFHQIFGQQFELYDIPVYKDGKLLELPFTGGLRAGQFSNIDFNDDGVLDLFIFDRNGDQIIPLINIGAPGEIKYRHAPEYVSVFPKLRNWALLYDYNQDGIMDIFTSSSNFPGSIEVWRGSKSNGRLSFKMVTFDYGLKTILQFPISNGFTQIYVSSIDLPAFADVDGDGDLDILTFEPDGSLLQYYQNLVKEEGLPIDSFKYIRKDVCWGRFFENEFSQDITLSSDPFSCATNFTGEGSDEGLRHSGSSVLVFDADGDGDMDLILGDLANKHLTFLKNGGTKQNAWMTEQDTKFPSYDIPAEIEVFLSSFFVDVDGDGIKDLIVTPNEAFNSENENHVWFYKNTGSNTVPVFKLEKKDLFIDEMLSFSNASHPAFFDYNANGLMDILVGTNGIITPMGNRINRMILLENVGTKDNPAYEIKDEDYLGFSGSDQFTGRFAPAFGDLDGDGDIDLLIGDVRGFLYYIENKGGAGNPVDFATPVYRYFNIFIGQNAKPQIIDLDGDGLMDIVIGEKNNQFNFFKNIGTPGNPSFNSNPTQFPNTDNLGNLYPGGNNFDTQSGAPFFIPYNDDYLMLFGVEIGKIWLVDNIKNNIYSNFNIVNENIGNINPGRRVTLALADINSNGYYEMVTGNERGGIIFYRTIFEVDSTVSTQDKTSIEEPIIFPNPVREKLFVKSETEPQIIKLYDLSGNEISISVNDSIIDLEFLPQGIYLIRIFYKNYSVSKKVVKI